MVRKPPNLANRLAQPMTTPEPLAEPAPSALRLYWRLLAGLVLVWLGCEAAALAGYGTSPALLVCQDVGSRAHVTGALGSVFFLQFASRPGRRELLTTAGLGLVTGAVLFFLKRQAGQFAELGSAVFAGVGLASLGVLSWRAWHGSGGRCARALGVLLPATLFAGSVALSGYLLRLTVLLCPRTNDALLYAADEVFGTQLSFAIGRAFVAVPALLVVSALVYQIVPAAFAALLALYQRADASQLRSPLPAFLLASAVGYMIYLVFPAAGPIFCFRAVFPAAPPAVSEVLANLPAVESEFRNAMPSLHTTWALLLWLHARPLARWFRVLTAVFLVFTLLATLGFGQHYAFDLVVAFPFTLAVQAATTAAPPRPRLAALALGAGLVVAWLLLLRFGLTLLVVSPPLTAFAALATVVISSLAEHRIWRRARLVSGRTRAGSALEPVGNFDEQIAGQDQPAAKE
jgi:hypothetical protein